MPSDRPFMEHPSGEFETAVDAMADAIERLRALREWDEWISFHAQGAGSRVGSYHCAVIKMCRGQIAFEQQLKLHTRKVTKRAAVPEMCLNESDCGYSIETATPHEAARIMDVIFREHLGIRPYDGEGDDYAIGADRRLPLLDDVHRGAPLACRQCEPPCVCLRQHARSMHAANQR